MLRRKGFVRAECRDQIIIRGQILIAIECVSLPTLKRPIVDVVAECIHFVRAEGDDQIIVRREVIVAVELSQRIRSDGRIIELDGLNPHQPIGFPSSKI